MFRFLILLFSLNLFSGGMLFGEIAKLPALAEHYRLHREEAPDTSLAEFLRLHYFDNEHRENSAHNHHSLPFHQHGAYTGASVICSLPAPTQDLVTSVASGDQSLAAANFYYCRYLPVGFVGSLFQPPKV